MSNAGPGIAKKVRVNSVAFTQTSGETCVPQVQVPLSLPVGRIPAGDSRSVLIPVRFQGCRADAHFDTAVTYTANDSTDVGTTTGTDSR